MLKPVEGLFIKLFIHYKAYLYRPLDYSLALNTTHTDTRTHACIYSHVHADVPVITTGLHDCGTSVCVCELAVWMQDIPLWSVPELTMHVCVCVHMCGGAWLLALVLCSPLGWTATTTAAEGRAHTPHTLWLCVCLLYTHSSVWVGLIFYFGITCISLFLSVVPATFSPPLSVLRQQIESIS